MRLKGGDPFVFGRGGEEALVLRAAGIPFEVVPGVTAGVAAPAYAGIPVTHRDLASGVAFVTGHEDPAKPETALDWPALAAFPGTLVFYMGVRALPRIAEQLIAGGRPADEPVAVVERGTLPGQRTVVATLATSPSARGRRGDPRARDHARRAGRRAARASSRWLEARPLHGRTVAVTRARAQASALAARLRELGAEVVEAPAIRIAAARPAALPDRRGYDLLCLTSPERRRRSSSSASRARPRRPRARAARASPRSARAPRGRCASTAIVADVVPERAVAEGLVEALAGVPVARALVARAAEGRDVLPDALRERGAEVDVLALYETVAEPLDDADARDGARARRLRHVHLRLDRALPRRARPAAALARPAARLDRPGHQRRAARARPEPDLEADRTRPTASSTRSSRTPTNEE